MHESTTEGKHRERNPRCLGEFESERTVGDIEGNGHCIQGGNGQISGSGLCTRQQNNEECYTVGEVAEDGSRSSLFVEGTAGEANGLLPSGESNSGLTGEIYAQTNWTLQSNGHRRNYTVEREVGQTNGLSYLIDEVNDQTNEMSCTDEIPSQQNRLNSRLEPPDDHNNEMRNPLWAYEAHINGVSHSTDAHGRSGQTSSAGNPGEGHAEQENRSNYSSGGCNAQASGWSQPADDGGSSSQPDGAASDQAQVRCPIEEDVTCSPVQESDVGEATYQRSVSQRNRASDPQVPGRVVVGFPIQELGQGGCHQHVENSRFNATSSARDNKRAVEHTCSQEELMLWNQQVNRSPPQKAVRKDGNAQGMFFIIKIKHVQQHRLYETPIFSYGVVTAEFKSMLGVRIYPNGVDGGRGTHVALFVHMMRGEYDSILDWPFTGRISVSIIDQSGAECRNHISGDIQATRQPGLVAFRQPAEAICRTGYGFVKFAPIGELFGPPYVKNDELFLKLEFA